MPFTNRLYLAPLSLLQNKKKSCQFKEVPPSVVPVRHDFNISIILNIVTVTVMGSK